jgi:hypothetical protein
VVLLDLLYEAAGVEVHQERGCDLEVQVVRRPCVRQRMEEGLQIDLKAGLSHLPLASWEAVGAAAGLEWHLISPVAAAVVHVRQARRTCQRLRLEGVLGTYGLALVVEMVHEAERKQLPLQSQLALSVSGEAAAVHVGLPS